MHFADCILSSNSFNNKMPPRKATACLRMCSSLVPQRPPYLPGQSSLLKHGRSSARRTLIAAPRSNSGPLMSRRSDRALPAIYSSWRVWGRTLPIFLGIVNVCALGMFNYQKSSSSIVAATLYALRTSELGRNELGDNIYFRDMWPWIWGEMNQLHGRVDIHFGVKGTKGKGVVRFRSERKGRMGKVS